MQGCRGEGSVGTNQDEMALKSTLMQIEQFQSDEGTWVRSGRCIVFVVVAETCCEFNIVHR